MRFSKVELDGDESFQENDLEVWLENDGDSDYKITWVEGNKYLTTEKVKSPNSDYVPTGIEHIEENLDSTSYGKRTIFPGLDREVENSLLLNERVYEGFCGEIQAAKLYDQARQSLEEMGVDLYDFVEWYQQTSTEMKEGLVQTGDKIVELFDREEENSGPKSDLKDYLARIELSGATVRKGDEEIGEISPQGESSSLLSQIDAKLVDGSLTKNPEKTSRLSEEK